MSEAQSSAAGPENIWDLVLARVKTKVNRHSFFTWFNPTAFLDDDGSTVRVKVPNDLFRDWLTKHYAGVIAEAVSALKRDGTVVSFPRNGQGR